MNLSSIIFYLIVSAVFAFAANVSAETSCAGARLGSHVSALPESWRLAVETLVASTASPGQPWSCVGGEVDLVVADPSATLTVTDAEGNTVSREVSSPDDVVPLGEALLAKPLPPEPEEPQPPAVPAPVEKEVAPALMQQPRLLVSAALGPRYAGPPDVLFWGMNVTAAVPFGAWGGGVGIRYDGFSTALDAPMPPMSELAISAVAFRGFSLGPVELRPGVRPSLVVVSAEQFQPKPPTNGPEPEPREPLEVSRIDFRIGLQTQLIVPFTPMIRGLLNVDGEVSPKELARSHVPHRPGEPRFVGHTLGLGIGVEVAVP